MAAPLKAALTSLVVALALLPGSAHAVELLLDRVTATTSAGEVKLRLTTRATFDFDPGAGVLVASGTWIGEYALPNQLTRFAHQVDNLRAAVDGTLTMRSAECVEGAFGAAFLNANLCGNYRFGPNGIDDGGLADDEVVAPPRSLAGYKVGSLDWDGSELTLVLAPVADQGTPLFAETALTLHFRVKP